MDNEKFSKKYTNHFLLGGLLLLAFLLRFYNLAENPAGFFRDEADKGYTAYSLMQTGQDQVGKKWPLFVRSLNVTTSALYQYINIPFIAAFGLNEFATRLPACLAGTASVLIAYLLARIGWGHSVALWAGLFICLSPWSLVMSRWANQSILLTVFVPLGVYFFARSGSFPPLRDALLSAFCFLLALYTYEPAQLVVPVLIVLLWLVTFQRGFLSTGYRRSYLFALAAFFLLFTLGALPMLHHILYETDESTARLSRISIFDDQPPFDIFTEFCKNYLLHLSPQFLFAVGDTNPRHNTLIYGQLHWYLLPVFLAGLIQAFRQRSHTDRILLAWFFVFPLAAACTRESIPHALRSIFAVPVFHLIAARGIMAFHVWRPNLLDRYGENTLRTARNGWYALLLFTTLWFTYELHVRYPLYSADYWEYGYREAVEWWQEHRNQADATVVSGIAEYPYIFFLFYDRYPPRDWIESQQIPGITFVPTGMPIEPYLKRDQGRLLLLARPMEIPQFKPEVVIDTPAGDPIWKWIAWGSPKSAEIPGEAD